MKTTFLERRETVAVCSFVKALYEKFKTSHKKLSQPQTAEQHVGNNKRNVCPSLGACGRKLCEGHLKIAERKFHKQLSAARIGKGARAFIRRLSAQQFVCERVRSFLEASESESRHAPPGSGSGKWHAPTPGAAATPALLGPHATHKREKATLFSALFYVSQFHLACLCPSRQGAYLFLRFVSTHTPTIKFILVCAAGLFSALDGDDAHPRIKSLLFDSLSSTTTTILNLWLFFSSLLPSSAVSSSCSLTRWMSNAVCFEADERETASDVIVSWRAVAACVARINI